MTTASSVARSAVGVRAVADDAMPSSLTASVAASLRAVGILIEVLDVSSSPSSRSSLIRSITTCSSMQIMYHTPVVHPGLPRLRSRFQLGRECAARSDRRPIPSEEGFLAFPSQRVGHGSGRRYWLRRLPLAVKTPPHALRAEQEWQISR